MVGAQGLFVDRQRALEERLGLRVAAMVFVESRQLVAREKRIDGRIPLAVVDAVDDAGEVGSTVA